MALNDEMSLPRAGEYWKGRVVSRKVDYIGCKVYGHIQNIEYITGKSGNFYMVSVEWMDGETARVDPMSLTLE